MFKRSRHGPLESPARLKPVVGSGEASDGPVTDVQDEADFDTMGESPGVDDLANLGVEGRAEYERLRTRLGLRDEHDESESRELLGRYRLEQELGRGGMGVVYRAHDPELGRPVAIKLVRSLPFATDTLSSRLLREAQVLAKLTHPHVVRVYDVGSHEGQVYLAMEYVDGVTLSEWQEGRTTAELLDAYGKVAQGLAAAHELGIVHRDFKPDNVLVANDARVLVSDFGLAGATLPHESHDESRELASASPRERHALVTKTGVLLGTMAYMAPEQLRGDVATPKSDQFAWCVSLWEALTGARPFAGVGRDELLASIERGVLPPSDRISKKLRRLLQTGLARDPADRHVDLIAVVDAIPRPRSMSLRRVGVLVGASLGLGLLASWLVLGELSPKLAECELELAVAGVRDSEAWAALRGRLAEAGLSEELRHIEGHLQRIDEQALALCRPPFSAQGDAQRQHLQLWVEDLQSLSQTADEQPLPEIAEEIDRIVRARLTAPPPRVLADDVVDMLKQSKELERKGSLGDALDAANEAVALAGDELLERSAAEQRRGRVLLLEGASREAMEAYGHATAAADGSAYDDARLEIELLAGKAAIMRLEDLDRGRDALARASGLLYRLDEPWWSPRRADYLELHAALCKREGDYPAALRDQWLVVLQRTLLGSNREIGRGYVNLGTIHERRGKSGDAGLATLYYEHALEVLEPTKPSAEWIQAKYSLGHMLARSEQPKARSRAWELLEQVRASSTDLRVAATRELLLMAMDQEPPPADTGQLAAVLRDELRIHPPTSASEGLDVWSVIATAAAMAADFATYDEALTEVSRCAELIHSTGAQPPDALLMRRVGIELSLASVLFGVDLARAGAHARTANELLLSLPVEERPKEMLEALEELLSSSP